MKKPPKVVKLVLQTVCMLLGVPPAEKKSKKTGKLKMSYWKAAQGKEVLGNPRLLHNSLPETAQTFFLDLDLICDTDLFSIGEE